MTLVELITLYKTNNVLIAFKPLTRCLNAKYPRYDFINNESCRVDGVNININNLTVSLRCFPIVVVEHNNEMFDPIITKKFYNHLLFNIFDGNIINHPDKVFYNNALAVNLPKKLTFEEQYSGGLLDAYKYEIALLEKKVLDFFASDLKYQYKPVHDFNNMIYSKRVFYKNLGISETGYKSKSEKKSKYSLTFKFDFAANKISVDNIIYHLTSGTAKLNKSEKLVLGFANFCFNLYKAGNFASLYRLKHENNKRIFDLSIDIFTHKVFLLDYNQREFINNPKQNSVVSVNGKEYKVKIIYKTK